MGSLWCAGGLPRSQMGGVGGGCRQLLGQPNLRSAVLSKVPLHAAPTLAMSGERSEKAGGASEGLQSSLQHHRHPSGGHISFAPGTKPGDVGHSPRTAALDRKDTPYPGWDEIQQKEEERRGVRQPQGKPAPAPGRRAHPPATHPAPLREAEEEAEGEQGSGGAGVRTAAAAQAAAAGSPPPHPHHAGKPPGPMLDAAHGGTVADDVIPPLGDADQP